MSGARHALDVPAGSGAQRSVPRRGPSASASPSRTGRSGRTSAAPDLREERLARARRAQFAILLLLTFVLTSGGRLADLLLAGRAASDGYSTGAVVSTAIGTRISELAPVPFLLAVGVIFFANLGRPRANLGGLVGAAVYLGTAQVTNTLVAGAPDPTPRYWVLLALVVALWSIAPEWDDLRTIGTVVVLIGVASLVTAVTGLGWMRSDALLSGESKAIVGTQLLAGIFPQMNVLGMTMTLGLPFVLLLRTRVLRWSGLAVVAVCLVLSASRTSLIAAGMIVVVAVILRLMRTPPSRRVAAVAAVVLIAAVVVVLPMTIDDRDALTSRGAIWMSSMSVIPDHFVIGLSTDAFTREGLLPPLIGHTPWHGHNLFVSTMVWGGIVLVLALVVFLTSVLVRAMRSFERSRTSYLFVLALISCSLAEMPLRIDDFDGVSWLTWIAVLGILMVPVPGGMEQTASRRERLIATRRSIPVGPQTVLPGSRPARGAPGRRQR